MQQFIIKLVNIVVNKKEKEKKKKIYIFLAFYYKLWKKVK
jgi:hypothetical protein